MPLKKGKKNIGSNIRELINKYKKTGKIGSSSPKNIAKARKQAIAVALSSK